MTRKIIQINDIYEILKTLSFSVLLVFPFYSTYKRFIHKKNHRQCMPSYRDKNFPDGILFRKQNVPNIGPSDLRRGAQGPKCSEDEINITCSWKTSIRFWRQLNLVGPAINLSGPWHTWGKAIHGPKQSWALEVYLNFINNKKLFLSR